MRLLISFKNLYLSSIILCTPYLLISLELSSVHASTFYIQNNCSYTVWAAALPGGGRELRRAQEWVLNTTDLHFTTDKGRIWPRTNCKFDEYGNGNCETGDCNGSLYCVTDGASPRTLAEYSVPESSSFGDFFDVSIVDGFNVPMEFRSESSNDCNEVIKCAGDVYGLCPTELRHTGGCHHPCTVFKNNQFCCTGNYNTPESCASTPYFKFFKDLCPNVYSYAYDDATSTFNCPTGTNYRIVFCPSTTSLA